MNQDQIMEGVLYKWTNYISGWQPRWFVLERGTLSYYESQEDAWKGCKGSIKVSVCEIHVHPGDLTRLDLTVPSEQYFYLRTLNAAERQKWLVALGTAKACLTDGRTMREKALQESTKALKSKMSELRLYCDLLLQQVGRIQESSTSDEDPTQVSSLLESTCSTFLRTLEECMLIANWAFGDPETLFHTPSGSPPVATVRPHKVKVGNQTNWHLLEKKRKNSSGKKEERRGSNLKDSSPGPHAVGPRSRSKEQCSAGDGHRDPEGALAAFGEDSYGKIAKEVTGRMEKTAEEGSVCAEKEVETVLLHNQKDTCPVPTEKAKVKGQQEVSSAENESGKEANPEEGKGHSGRRPNQNEAQQEVGLFLNEGQVKVSLEQPEESGKVIRAQPERTENGQE